MGAEARFEREFFAGVEKSGVKKSGVGPPQSRSFANSRAGGSWYAPFDAVIAGMDTDASSAKLFNSFAKPLHTKVKTSAASLLRAWRRAV